MENDVTEKVQAVLEGVIKRLKKNEDLWAPCMMAWDVENEIDIGVVESLKQTQKYKHGMVGLIVLTINKDVEWTNEGVEWASEEMHQMDRYLYQRTLEAVARHIDPAYPAKLTEGDASDIICSWESVMESQGQDCVIRLLECTLKKEDSSR